MESLEDIQVLRLIFKYVDKIILEVEKYVFKLFNDVVEEGLVELDIDYYLGISFFDFEFDLNDECECFFEGYLFYFL